MTAQLEQPTFTSTTSTTRAALLRKLIQANESSFSTASLEVFPVTVTPNLAQQWLSNKFDSKSNREVSKNTVKTYAKKMQEGQWKNSALTGEVPKQLHLPHKDLFVLPDNPMTINQ